jgi:hypothetical protein
MLGKTAIISAVFLFLGAGLIYAAIPNSISFQGQLLDSAGEPVTGSQQITFTIYNISSGVERQQTETPTLDKNGLYNVELNVSGINLNQPLWLGVRVGSDAEMTPRIKILPTATALYAVKAGSVSISDIYDLHPTLSDNFDNVGVGEANLALYGDGILRSSPTASIIFDADHFNLIGAGFGTSVSTVMISTAPYALFAGTASYVSGTVNAETLDALDSTQLLRSDAGAIIYSTHIVDGQITDADVNLTTAAISFGKWGPAELVADADYDILVSSAKYVSGVTADNLGNHTAIQDLQMGTNTIRTTAQRLTISSNTYIVGYASATAFYGDGFNLTGVQATVGADSIGRYHIINSTIQVADIDLSSVTLSRLTNDAGFILSSYDGFVSTQGDTVGGTLEMSSATVKFLNAYDSASSTIGTAGMTVFYGDGSNLSGVADMEKTVYDININNIVDTAEDSYKLGGVSSSSWATDAEVANSTAPLLGKTEAATTYQKELGTATWTAADSYKLGGVSSSSWATDAEVANSTSSLLSKSGGTMSGNLIMGWQDVKEVNVLDVNSVQIEADTNKKIATNASGIGVSTTTVVSGDIESKTVKLTLDINPASAPSALGILGVDQTDWALYISTSTNPGGWQKVGTQ